METTSKIHQTFTRVLPVPPSTSTCDLWVIDAAANIVCTTAAFVDPQIKGHENLNLPTFTFYIHNLRLNKRILFDNGARKDWWNLPPHVVQAITTQGMVGLDVKKDVHEVLVAGGVEPNTIDAIVWSHIHYDHIGNMNLFPLTTDLIVGPGFGNYLPAYPAGPNSPILQADLEGRHIQEVAFNNADLTPIGPFKGYDFFGDGSFYLIHTPGHTPGHMSALVRTTPETFVFLGGDICHFTGLFRPSEYVPIPASLSVKVTADSRLIRACDCSPLSVSHVGSDEPLSLRNSPIYQVSQSPDSWNHDPKEAQRTVNSLKELDACSNVFVAITHDPALWEIGHFPNHKLNHWKEQNLKEKQHWRFLRELPIDGQPGRPLIAPGVMRDGQLVSKPA